MIKDKSASSKLLDVVVYFVMIFMLVITLYPVLYVFASSLSGRIANESGAVTVIPVDFTLDSYKMVFTSGTVPRAFLNSVLYTVAGTAVNLIFTGTFSYVLSRKGLPLRGFYTAISIIPMYFSGGMIPTFLLVKNLGLYNSMWALILPGTISITNMIIMRTFFQNLPDELEESAALDGANEFVIFVKIILPLSQAIIFTIGLYYAVSHWNSWFSSMIYFKDSVKYPLQMILRQIVIQTNDIKEAAISGEISTLAFIGDVNVTGVKYATLSISIIPMLIIYPFVQKHFMKGVMIGSLKG